MIKGTMHKHHFDKLGGVTLKLVYPSDQGSKEFLESDEAGKFEAHLANFGHYQFGSSITAPVYMLTVSKNACEPIGSIEEAQANELRQNKNGFILIEADGCSFETKARNTERFGGQVALIIEPSYMSFRTS